MTKNWREARLDELGTLLSKQRVGLITDVDGTISPIAKTPDAARVTEKSKDLLRSMTGSFTLVAVVSGRAVEDVRSRVGVPGVVYVGNHGLERWQDGKVHLSEAARSYRNALEAARDKLEREVPEDMYVEDKGATLSIHYRSMRDPEAAADNYRPVVERISKQYGLRVFEGRMVFEVRPPVDANKGSALRDLIKEFKLDAALYIGDDTTDVDAFKVAQSLREEGKCYALAFGVDSEETPDEVRESADFLVEGVSGVEDFFGWLASALKESSS